MFGLFKSAPFIDPQLGSFRRSRGAWRGALALDGAAPVPLVLSGGRAAPDAEALRIAHSLASEYASWRPMIARGLFEHYSPYAEAVAAGGGDTPVFDLFLVRAPSSVWRHTNVPFICVIP